MKSYIFQVSENAVPFKNEVVYVKASENAIRAREYAGGFLRFLSSCYDDAENYSGSSTIDGQKIMSLKEFDEWRKNHYCC